MEVSKSFQRYLERYAEPEIALIDELRGSWERVVAIPACSEDEGFLRTMETLSAADGAEETLLLIVVNGAEDAPLHKHERNLRFLHWLRALLGCGSGPIAQGTFETMDVCVVDRASEGRRLPARQGVGLARKISVDIPAALYLEGRVKCPWVHSTDADVEVPKGYLKRVPERTGASAGLHPYAHVLEGEDEQRMAMLQYEAYLHYYTLGLAWADSPYAYTAIGSTIVVHLEYYAAVRGFPKREAGEDFYLLNKLAKVGDVVGLQGESIQVQGRFSDRVPFGTGAALGLITSDESRGQEYLMYDPVLFEILREVLICWHDYGANPELDKLSTGLKGLDKQWPGTWKALDDTGLMEAAGAGAKHAKPGPSLRRRLSEWMDAFRTLKILHRLRDEVTGSVPWREAIENACFCPNVDRMSPEEICAELRARVDGLNVSSSVLGTRKA